LHLEVEVGDNNEDRRRGNGDPMSGRHKNHVQQTSQSRRSEAFVETAATRNVRRAPDSKQATSSSREKAGPRTCDVTKIKHLLIVTFACCNYRFLDCHTFCTYRSPLWRLFHRPLPIYRKKHAKKTKIAREIFAFITNNF